MTRAGAAATNDNYADRVWLSGENVTTASTTAGNTLESGESATASGFALVSSMWYAWTAPTNGILYLKTTPVNQTTKIVTRAFQEATGFPLSLLATNSDGGVPVNQGQSVAIQVAMRNGLNPASVFSLNLRFETWRSVTNDNFADRQTLGLAPHTESGSLYQATSEIGEPLPSVTATQTVWWKVTAPSDSLLTIRIPAVEFDSWVTLYKGTNLTSLQMQTAIETNQISFRLDGGQEYALQIASSNVFMGNFSLETRVTDLQNDYFSNRTVLVGSSVNVTANNLLATTETAESLPNLANAGKTLWYSWTAPASGRVSIETSSTNLTPVLGVYVGNSLGGLQLVAAGDGALDFAVTGGTTYQLQFDGANGGAGEFTFKLDADANPSGYNDFFSDALPFSEITSITEATLEPGEPNHLTNQPCKSLWWRLTSPMTATTYLKTEGSSATNLTVSVYSGFSVDSLSLVARGDTGLTLNGTALVPYMVAIASPTNVSGDVNLRVLTYVSGFQTTPTVSVPGNLLKEPSWEGTDVVNAQYWQLSGNVFGTLNAKGGADGTTWPTLFSGGKVSQTFTNTAGQTHAVRFAARRCTECGGGDGVVKVYWNGELARVLRIPEPEVNVWHWFEFTGVATGAVTQVAFEAVGKTVDLDAFSVVPLTAPPQITVQPQSLSVPAGGSALFVVGMLGSQPLTYQWFLDGSPFAVTHASGFLLSNVTNGMAGTWHAVITNAYGAVTTAPVTLTVKTETKPVILWQPYGDRVGIGGDYTFNVVAAGTPPLSYQWYQDGQLVPNATNRDLTLSSITTSNAGSYQVQVQNALGAVWSLPANLSTTNVQWTAALVNFQNYRLNAPAINAPVFDTDGITRLSSSNYLAQLYGGPSLEWMRPVGRPVPFVILPAPGAGYFVSSSVILPTVPMGAPAVLQVRAWEASKGGSYEAARAMGGKFGKSALLSVTTSAISGTSLTSLQSFSLQAGAPQFASGVISFVSQTNNLLTWSHQGEVGFRYLIERSAGGFEWQPFAVITNTTSAVLFSDTQSSSGPTIFYRSRILD